MGIQGRKWLPNTGWASSNVAHGGVPPPPGGAFYSTKIWVGNCPPCPSHHLRPWYIYIPYFIISTVALSVGLLAVPLYILVKAYKTKVCPKNPIPEFNTEAQKKINDLETETLKLNEEIKKH